VLITGERLKQTPRTNPVRRGYELHRYADRASIDGGQPSYDQAAVPCAAPSLSIGKASTEPDGGVQ